MILIVGGACQGKAEYARSLIKNCNDVESAGIADGMSGRWDQAAGRTCLLNFHGFLRQVLEEGLNPDVFTEEVLCGGPAVVTMDEVGSGIVPVEQKERDYREAVGRAGQRLAMEADEVYRMVCGILMRIK